MAHARPPGRHRRGRLLTGEGGFSGLGPPLGACGPRGGARRLLHGVHVWIYFHLGRTPRPPSRPSFRHRSPIDCLTESLSATLGLCFCSCSIEGETWTGARASSEVPRCETAHGRRGAPRNSDSNLSPRRRSGGSSTGPRARSSQQPLHFKRASDSQRSRREQRVPPTPGLALRPRRTPRRARDVPWGRRRDLDTRPPPSVHPPSELGVHSAAPGPGREPTRRWSPPLLGLRALLFSATLAICGRQLGRSGGRAILLSAARPVFLRAAPGLRDAAGPAGLSSNFLLEGSAPSAGRPPCRAPPATFSSVPRAHGEPSISTWISGFKQELKINPIYLQNRSCVS